MPVMSTTDQARAVQARDAALQGALRYIERKFGKGAVMRMSDQRARVRCDAIPPARSRSTSRSGSAACRAGGSWRSSARSPRARRRSIYHVLAEAQKLGGICAFIDAEHAMDPLYAQADRRRHRRAARVPARQRRAGARDRRHAGALRRGRGGRDRLGRGADPEAEIEGQMGD